jgi:hypothetical protein
VTPSGSAPERQNRPHHRLDRGPKPPGERELKPLDYLVFSEAVETLGLTEATCTAWGAGYAPKGIMRDRLAIPIHDPISLCVSNRRARLPADNALVNQAPLAAPRSKPIPFDDTMLARDCLNAIMHSCMGHLVPPVQITRSRARIPRASTNCGSQFAALMRLSRLFGAMWAWVLSTRAKSVQDHIDELHMWSDGTRLPSAPMTGMQWLIWSLAAAKRHTGDRRAAPSRRLAAERLFPKSMVPSSLIAIPGAAQ